MLRAFQLGGTELQSKLLGALFEAYGEKSKDLGDPETLADIADAAGVLPREEVRRHHFASFRLTMSQALTFVESEELAEDVEKMVAASRANGVAGVPFTVIDDKWAISGGQAPDVYYKVRKLPRPHRPSLLTTASLPITDFP